MVSKSECDINETDSSIFSRDLIGQYLYDIQLIKRRGEKNSKHTTTIESEKTGRTKNLQKRHVFRQTYRQPSVPNIKNLDPDIVIPPEESFAFETLVAKPRQKPRCGDQHGYQQQSCQAVSSNKAPISCSRSNLEEQVTCSSHVYTFNKGLIPSREVHNIELLDIPHFLPPIVAERIGNMSEQKHYRLLCYPVYVLVYFFMEKENAFHLVFLF